MLREGQVFSLRFVLSIIEAVLVNTFTKNRHSVTNKSIAHRGRVSVHNGVLLEGNLFHIPDSHIKTQDEYYHLFLDE